MNLRVNANEFSPCPVSENLKLPVQGCEDFAMFIFNDYGIVENERSNVGEVKGPSKADGLMIEKRLFGFNLKLLSTIH